MPMPSRATGKTSGRSPPIGQGGIIRKAIIGEGCSVRGGAVSGGAFRDGETRQISVVGKDHTIDVNQVVKPGEVI